jgi:hypothetical protein
MNLSDAGIFFVGLFKCVSKIPPTPFFFILQHIYSKTFLIMGQRLIISEEERSRISGMYGLLNEKANMDKQVAGPFKGQGAVKYYIYQIGSKFYIYMTNASHKEPTLMDGTDWDNDGKGYPNQMEAQKVIDNMLKDPDQLNEQTRLLLPRNLRINTLYPASREVSGTLELDNRTVKVDGDNVRVTAKVIEPKPENDESSKVIVRYDCKEDKYYSYRQRLEGWESEIFLSPKAKEALKNIKTYCSGSSAAL